MTSLDDNSTVGAITYDTVFTRNIKLGVLIALQPPAFICNCILIYYLITDRKLRQTLHYHSILILLMICLLLNGVEVPRIMHYLRNGIVIPQTDINCLMWQWFDYTLGGLVNIFMLRISAERHLFIFHGYLFNTVKRRLLFHYFPLMGAFTYVYLFYIGAFFIHPCQQEFDVSQPLCGFPCYTYQSDISLYDLFAHIWLPIVISVLLDIALIVRAVYRKRVGEQQQRAQWRKHRRMISQLFIISSLFAVIQTPYALILFIQLFGGIPDFANYVQVVYFYYFLWLFALIFPFACIGCLPEVVKKVKNLLIDRLRPNNTVVPATMIALRRTVV